MVRAYEIESQEAIFPRIVVDDYALAQHQSDESLRSEANTSSTRSQRSIACSPEAMMEPDLSTI